MFILLIMSDIIIFRKSKITWLHVFTEKVHWLLNMRDTCLVLNNRLDTHKKKYIYIYLHSQTTLNFTRPWIIQLLKNKWQISKFLYAIV